MDLESITTRTELESMLSNKDAEPRALALSLLKEITNNFSDDKEIGYGGFAVVYKGMLGNGTVAVKKLSETLDIEDTNFKSEVRSLMIVKHKNIIRFLGYCSDTQGKMVDYNGKNVFADARERLLCFEYLPNGSLEKQITDASCGHGWTMRYQIISDICEGLYYLHQENIVHRDLKPANILLDGNMRAKISDFGLSRIFEEKQTRDITSKLNGSRGYMAPESLSGEITLKFDIYSLGVIIKDILGVKGDAIVKDVLDGWTKRLDTSKTQLLQVRVCTEIAIECIDYIPAKRPDIKVIITRLGKTQSADDSTETGESSSSSEMEAEAIASDDLQPSTPHIHTERSSESPSSLERKSVANCYELPTRSLTIAWVDNPQFWRWISDPQSSYGECAELLSVYSLVVYREIIPKELPLPASARYTVYLVYKLAPSTLGLRDYEQKSKIKLYGGIEMASSRVSLHPPIGSKTDGVTYPESRGNGWLKLRLGEFGNKETVIVELRHEDANIEKSGLIIAGMEVWSHDAKANASGDLQQSTPQLPTEISSEGGPSSLEKRTAENCYMLPLRSLAIAWGDYPQYWRWVSNSNSRYNERAELLSVYYLVVSREITPKDLPLPTATLYTVYLVYKLAPRTLGLRGSEQMSNINLYGERVIATSRVSLHPHGGSATVGVTYPVTRDDGWLELWLGEFDNKNKVIVELRHENAHIEKSGLILAGMEVRSHEVRTN